MSRFIEIFMVAAALLADLLLGNYGCTPCLTVFVIFRASESVSVRFAVVLTLLTGTAVDLIYCRSGAVTPLLMTAALFAGRLVFGAVGAERDRGFADALLPGAVMGIVMSLGEILMQPGGRSWLDLSCTIVSGALFGALECVAVLALLDAVSGFLGLNMVIRRDPRRRDRSLPRRQTRRVRAANIMRRRR